MNAGKTAKRVERWELRERATEIVVATGDPGWEDFLRSDAGHPLGSGMPPGRPIRLDGQTHREGWKSVLRQDVCAYCGQAGGTLDHIEPKCMPARAPGGLHTWLNYTGACEACNGSKADRKLILWLAQRAAARPRRRIVAAAA